MLTLSKELLQAVRESGNRPLRVSDPDSQAEYVVLSADVFDRLVGRDLSGRLSREEQLGLLAAAGERAGWNDPEMDAYDELDPRRK